MCKFSCFIRYFNIFIQFRKCHRIFNTYIFVISNSVTILKYIFSSHYIWFKVIFKNTFDKIYFECSPLCSAYLKFKILRTCVAVDSPCSRQWESSTSPHPPPPTTPIQRIVSWLQTGQRRAVSQSVTFFILLGWLLIRGRDSLHVLLL